MQNNFDFGLNIFRLHVLKVYTLKKISHLFLGDFFKFKFGGIYFYSYNTF